MPKGRTADEDLTVHCEFIRADGRFCMWRKAQCGLLGAWIAKEIQAQIVPHDAREQPGVQAGAVAKMDRGIIPGRFYGVPWGRP